MYLQKVKSKKKLEKKLFFDGVLKVTDEKTGSVRGTVPRIRVRPKSGTLPGRIQALPVGFFSLLVLCSYKIEFEVILLQTKPENCRKLFFQILLTIVRYVSV
jgi:hypothetical protein